MARNSLFTRSSKALLSNVAFAVLGIAFMQASHAGCGQYDPPSKSAVDWRTSSSGSVQFIRAEYRVVDDESSDWREHAKPPITGLWYFTYLTRETPRWAFTMAPPSMQGIRFGSPTAMK